MSVEDTRKHLDNGHFNRVFDLLKLQARHESILLLAGSAMKVGAKITKRQRNYIKRVSRMAYRGQDLFIDKQIKYALKEYENILIPASSGESPFAA